MHRAISISVIIGAIAIGPAAAADLVVVEAMGVPLKPGQILDDGQTLTLREGQRVTLLASNGNLLKLRGPYDQAPGAGGPQGDSNFSQGLRALLSAREARTGEVGIVRAKTDRIVLPEPWVVSAEQAGTFCVRDGKPIVFWRGSTAKAATLTVAPLDRSWKMTATWSQGMDRLTMPEGIPVKLRSTYLVDLDGNRTAITLNTIPTAVRTDAMAAGWMIEKGCEAQAEALLPALR
jgi:hypothetical protein